MRRATLFQLTCLALAGAVAAWLYRVAPLGVHHDYGLAALALLCGLVVLVDMGKLADGTATFRWPALSAGVFAAMPLFRGGADGWTIALVGCAGLLILVALAQFSPEDQSAPARATADPPGPPAPAATAATATSTAEPSGHTLTYVACAPTKSFAHVIGLDDLKAELLAAGKEISRRRTADATNGILLWGEPGTGKTMLAQALACELGLPWLNVTVGELASRWINQTTEQVQAVFQCAAAQAPCLLFIDELDSLLIDRGAIASAESESTRTVNALLTNLTAIRGKGVIVVAATNYLSRLDGAGVREGRFDYKFEVPLPDRHARLCLMREELEARLRHASVDDAAVERLTAKWEGFSPARIRHVAAEGCRMFGDTPDTHYGYHEWASALRRVQGSLGDVLPERVGSLSTLTLMPQVAGPMDALARHMGDLDRVERLGGSLPRGVLLAGPPGTGKTLAAMSLARTCGWAFVQGSGATLRHPDAVAELVRRARDLRPAIIFVDEADELLGSRAMSLDPTLTNALLTAIDGARGSACDLLWLAATNFPQRLDPAATRGGRFEETIHFTPYDHPTLTRFIDSWLKQSPARFDRRLGPAAIAAWLGVETPANAAAILQQAVNLMLARADASGSERVQKSDLLVAQQSVRGRSPGAAIGHVVPSQTCPERTHDGRVV